MANNEKSFIRDNSFSLWHRQLHGSFYMQDQDHVISSHDSPKNLWTPYGYDGDDAKVYCFIEEKHSNIQTLDLKNNTQFKTLRAIAREIPAFCLIKHHDKFFTFYVIAANKAASEFLLKLCGKEQLYLSEKDYFNFEAQLRCSKAKPAIPLSNEKFRFKLPLITNYK